MTETQLQTYGLDRPESGDDVVVPFTLEREGDRFDVSVTSADRDRFMKPRRLQ